MFKILQSQIYREEERQRGRAGVDLIRNEEARGFFQVLHVGTGSQGFGPSSTAFPGHKKGAGWEAELRD